MKSSAANGMAAALRLGFVRPPRLKGYVKKKVDMWKGIWCGVAGGSVGLVSGPNPKAESRKAESFGFG